MVPQPQSPSLTGPRARQPRVAGLRINGATIVTMNDAFEVIEGDVLVRDGRIAAVGAVAATERVDRVIDAHGAFLVPGLIQTHVHLCQTLFRGYADDLALLDWLKTRVWPMEAAHTPASLAAAARQAASELLMSGTTTVLTMETVHDTDSVFESVAIAKRWHGRANGRLRAAFAPRFAVSCSQDLLEAVAALSQEHGLVVHTHASESRDEIALIRERTGRSNIDYLAHTGLASPRLCLAHCAWVDDHEQSVMAEHGVKVLHCPGSNLKLGSGLAPIVEMRAKGISVSLGADGAACNNHLDMFEEMRLAAVLQSVRRGPGALTARDALWMATREGARAIGLEQEIGSIEAGKRADFILVDRDRPQFMASHDPFSTLVYSARGTDVRTTVVDGEVLIDDFRPTRWDPATIATEARGEAARLAARAGF